MSRREFQLLVKPAGADCNLRCGYCFYLDADHGYGRDGPHRMSDAVLTAMIRQTLAVRMKQTVFCWQGGEPTLCGLDFYRRAVAAMQRLGQGGQSVANALQTNGLPLDDEWAGFLGEYQFLVGVSLDGPVTLHDHHRVNHAGRGSQAKAVAAAHLLEDRGVPVNILCVVNDRSRADEVYPYLRKEGFRHLQFIPCAERDATGQMAPFSVSPQAYGRFLCDVFDLWLADDYRNVCIRQFDNVISQLADRRSLMCIFDRRCDQYLVVEYNGDVFPCDFFVEPGWRLGNLLETPLPELAASPRAGQFAAMKGELAAQCRACRYVSLCQGECPKYRMIGAGRHEAPTHFCESYMMFFDHTVDRLGILADRIRAARHELTA